MSETAEKRIPKVWMACAKHPDAGSQWIHKDGRTWLWCWECKGPVACERPAHDFYEQVTVRVEMVKGDGAWTVRLGANERILSVDHEGNTAWVYILKDDEL